MADLLNHLSRLSKHDRTGVREMQAACKVDYLRRRLAVALDDGELFKARMPGDQTPWFRLAYPAQPAAVDATSSQARVFFPCKTGTFIPLVVNHRQVPRLLGAGLTACDRSQRQAGRHWERNAVQARPTSPAVRTMLQRLRRFPLHRDHASLP